MEKLGRDYDGLDLHGQKTVRAVADVEKARCSEAAQAAPAQTYDDIDRQVEDYRRLILEKNQAERLSPSNVDGTQTVSNKPAQPGGEYRRGLLMNNEEKILALLAEMQQEQKQMRQEQTQMRQEQMQMRQEQMQMQQEQKQMHEEIDAIKLHLELNVEKRFDAVNESIDAILEMLTPKSQVDELKSDVIVLKTAVKTLTQEVAKPKKAQ